jgi:REP element-mobilizing transposase RayT
MQIAQKIANKPRSFVGHQLWTGSYFVSTVYVHERVVRAYIENQEAKIPGLGNLFDRSQVTLTASSGS